MKISVIIPVYNCEKYLERSLDSVLRQRFDDGDELQVITVDDGSTDGSGAVLDRYAAEHSNIQVLHQPNQGVSAARNHALDLAEGDYIHFVDGDDFLVYDNSYLKLLEILKSGGDPIDVLRIHMVSFYQGKDLELDQFKDLAEIEIEFDGSGREHCHNLLFEGYACISIVCRNLIEKLNLRFNTNAHIDEDAMFNLELYNYATRVVQTNAAIYGYYRHDASASYSNNKKKLRSTIDNLFANLPATVAILDLYEDPYFKKFRMETYGTAIGTRLFKVPMSYGAFKRYIKRGFDCGIFPVAEMHDEKNERYLNSLLKYPFLFWLSSFLYRYIFIPLIKPLILKNG